LTALVHGEPPHLDRAVSSDIPFIATAHF
jgi:hypothetical protein